MVDKENMPQPPQVNPAQDSKEYIIPVVAQEITKDRDLYPAQKYGMLDKVRTPARWTR